MVARTIETNERSGPGMTPGVPRIAAVLMIAVGIGIAYRVDRAYRAWWKANHPFAGAKAGIERMGATSRATRANLAEVAHVLWEVVGELDRASEFPEV